MKQFMLWLHLLSGKKRDVRVSGPRMAAIASRYFRSLRGLKMRGFIRVLPMRGEYTQYSITDYGRVALRNKTAGLKIDWAPSWLAGLEWSVEESLK